MFQFYNENDYSLSTTRQDTPVNRKKWSIMITDNKDGGKWFLVRTESKDI